MREHVQVVAVCRGARRCEDRSHLPSRFYLELQVSRGNKRRNLCLTSYSLHMLRYLLHSEGIPFPRVIIVFEYYKGRRLRPKEVVYFGRLEPVDPPALVHHGGQGLVAYCSSILTEVSFLQLRFTEVGLCELRLCRLTEVGLLQLSALVMLASCSCATRKVGTITHVMSN